MASKSFKRAQNSFARDLLLEERTSRARPGALTSGNEQQSELEPSYRPPAPTGTPRARPKAAAPRPKAPPLPPRRPRDPIPPPLPIIPTEPIPPAPTLPDFSTLPQVDPLGNVTGPITPAAPASSAQGPIINSASPPPPAVAGPPPNWSPQDIGASARAAPPAGPAPPGGADPTATGSTPPAGLLDALEAYIRRTVPPLRNPF
jgi:hypothetical protein